MSALKDKVVVITGASSGIDAALEEDIDDMMRVNVELAFFDRRWPKTFR